MFWIVQVGLTRRLIDAPSAELAKQEFVNERIMRRHLGELDDVLDVHVASQEEISEFVRRRQPKFDQQVAFELDDLRQGYA